MTTTLPGSAMQNLGDKLAKAMQIADAKAKQEARNAFLATPPKK
jgi:hypothetical protein